MIDLEAIKRAAEAATPGPWGFGSYGRVLVVPLFDGAPDKYSPICDVGEQHFTSSGDVYNDANHIASANPAAVLELIARLESAERDNANLRRLLAVSASGSDLYTDDGELTDASQTMLIDYKRDAVEEIEQKLRDRALDALAEINVSLGLTDQ